VPKGFKSFFPLGLLAFGIASYSAAFDLEQSVSSVIESDLWQDNEIGIRLNLDSSRFNGIHRTPRVNEYVLDNEVRRARLSIKAPINQNWSTKLQLAINVDDDTYEAKDLYLRYDGGAFPNLKIGQSKEPFGLENITSSANLAFTERSLSPFSLGRSKGMNIADSKRNFSWSFGVYKVDKNSKVKADGKNAYTGRITFSPHTIDKKYNHLGFAYSKRNLDGADYEIKSKAGVNRAFNFLDTKNISTDTIEKSGIELAWGRGALSFQGEYQHLQINAMEITKNASYQAFYTQLSYFLTDDHRPYRKGRLSSVKPISKKGAIELTLRKGELHSVHIGSENKNPDITIATTVLGINYYLNRHVNLMLNASDTESSGIVNEGQDSGSALTFRAQIRL
jgi:phosphate-selective porin OprO/OprP